MPPLATYPNGSNQPSAHAGLSSDTIACIVSVGIVATAASGVALLHSQRKQLKGTSSLPSFINRATVESTRKSTSPTSSSQQHSANHTSQASTKKNTSGITERPLIGITRSSSSKKQPDEMMRAIKLCGGEPVVLDSRPDQVATDLQNLAGLVFTGGADIDPSRYGEGNNRHGKTQQPDKNRDEYEAKLMLAAAKLEIPTLAICRGMHVANVAWGGSLHQHIPALGHSQVNHNNLGSKYKPFDEHTVTVTPDSLLAKYIGTTSLPTNSTHHQAVRKIGSGLHAVAHTQDKMIEALERPASNVFWLALQWHPERLLTSDNGQSRKIFDRFIAAAKAR